MLSLKYDSVLTISYISINHKILYKQFKDFDDTGFPEFQENIWTIYS